MGTYLGVVLNLIQRRFIEAAGVPVESAKLVRLLYTGKVTPPQTALVNAADP